MSPARLAPILFATILSGVMSPLVSGIATLRAVGLSEAVAGLLLGDWLSSWVVAFPAVLILAPVARCPVARVTRPD